MSHDNRSAWCRITSSGDGNTVIMSYKHMNDQAKSYLLAGKLGILRQLTLEAAFAHEGISSRVSDRLYMH